MTAFVPDMTTRPDVAGFFDPATNTISYVVRDPAGTGCAVIDSVMDFDYASGRITHDHADQIIAFIGAKGWTLDWLIETHVHADHLSAAPYIQGNEGTEFQRDGSQFDALFKDGDTYDIGSMTAQVMHTPGHTPACMTHVIGDAAFVGDTLFMPDGGSARADFPGGDAGILYDSIQRVLALPDEMRLFMCHDYGPNGRDIRWETTVGDERRHNIHIAGKSRDDFVLLLRERDKTLAMPKLILPSLQVNMRAGEVPKDGSGRPMLKVPVNGL